MLHFLCASSLPITAFAQHDASKCRHSDHSEDGDCCAPNDGTDHAGYCADRYTRHIKQECGREGEWVEYCEFWNCVIYECHPPQESALVVANTTVAITTTAVAKTTKHDASKCRHFDGAYDDDCCAPNEKDEHSGFCADNYERKVIRDCGREGEATDYCNVHQCVIYECHPSSNSGTEATSQQAAAVQAETTVNRVSTTCSPGYHHCPTKNGCDINEDCIMDQNCDRNLENFNAELNCSYSLSATQGTSSNSDTSNNNGTENGSNSEESNSSNADAVGGVISGVLIVLFSVLLFAFMKIRRLGCFKEEERYVVWDSSPPRCEVALEVKREKALQDARSDDLWLHTRHDLSTSYHTAPAPSVTVHRSIQPGKKTPGDLHIEKPRSHQVAELDREAKLNQAQVEKFVPPSKIPAMQSLKKRITAFERKLETKLKPDDAEEVEIRTVFKEVRQIIYLEIAKAKSNPSVIHGVFKKHHGHCLTLYDAAHERGSEADKDHKATVAYALTIAKGAKREHPKPRQPDHDPLILLRNAMQIKDEYNKLLQVVFKKLPPGGKIVRGTHQLKGLYRIIEKAAMRPGSDKQDICDKIFDVVRGMIVCQDDKSIEMAIREYSKYAEIIRVKERLQRESRTSEGWGDIMINFKLKLKEQVRQKFTDGQLQHICEVQLCRIEMYSIRTDLKGHEDYAMSRASLELHEANDFTLPTKKLSIRISQEIEKCFAKDPQKLKEIKVKELDKERKKAEQYEDEERQVNQMLKSALKSEDPLERLKLEEKLSDIHVKQDIIAKRLREIVQMK